MATIVEKQKNTHDALKGDMGYSNVMQTPKIEKVTVTVGIGKVSDRNKVKLIKEKLALITGQRPVDCAAKQSIAQFKLREGMLIGYKVTLRGKRMNLFLDKLINVAIPRTRDFRGLNITSVDEMGNMSIGIKENTIFPETSDEDLRDVFGMNITITTSAKSKEEAQAYFKHMGIPFKK